MPVITGSLSLCNISRVTSQPVARDQLLSAVKLTPLPGDEQSSVVLLVLTVTVGTDSYCPMSPEAVHN